MTANAPAATIPGPIDLGDGAGRSSNFSVPVNAICCSMLIPFEGRRGIRSGRIPPAHLLSAGRGARPRRRKREVRERRPERKVVRVYPVAQRDLLADEPPLGDPQA